MAGGRWLKEAVWSGLEQLDVDHLLNETARHVTTKGEWLQGVISPSLVATQCRLQRLKKFLGHAPQPGFNHMAVRRGRADAVSNYNMLRGFLMEGVLVTALAHSLQDRLLDNAPTLLFDYTHPGDEVVPPNTRFTGHPDVMVVDEDGMPALIQIKTPSVFKMDRVERQGDQDALKTYGPQMATELYIGRKMGIPLARNYLLLSTWEATAKVDRPRVMVVEYDWEEEMVSIPEEVAREVVLDAEQAVMHDLWPEALPAHQWDVWPCSYCQYPRNGDFEKIGCTENQEWQRFKETGQTRLDVTDVPPEQIPDNVVPMKRRRRRSA